MINVTRLNKEPFMVNGDMIEMIEEKPDTVIMLASGRKLIVSETAEELRKRIIAFRREIYISRE